MKPIRLMLVDDHEMVRAGLRTLFAGEEGIEVVCEAATVARAIGTALEMQPDVVLMDLRLPDGSGVDACREIMSALPATRVVFLTSYSEDLADVSTILAGAAGHLLKDISRDALVRAVREAVDGPPFYQRDPGQRVAQRLRAEPTLSRQEYRVLALVVEGKTNREIGAELALSEKTVRNYLSNAFQKLGVSRRSEAAARFAGGRLSQPR